ncbi:MAG: polysaccharide deacetylase family protein [Acidiferrobacter sp.]
MTVIFMHHDIMDSTRTSRSGFCGPGAELYKVSRTRFREQLAELAQAFPDQAPALKSAAPFALTFDDGGVSATETVAELLAERGWHAHFFIATGFLGMPGFVSVSGLRGLIASGHSIGTHTVTHPSRLQALPYPRIVREWTDSRLRLQDLLGCAVTTGSVPGGYGNKAVRMAAVAAGLSLLLTSEPTTRCDQIGDLTVRGRFAVLGGDAAGLVTALARQAHARRLKAWRWHALSVAKQALGPAYPALREGLLRLRTEKTGIL